MQLRWQIAQFCELLWWRLYLARKPKAAYLAWKKAYWSAFLQKSGVPVNPGASVLDAGCGPAGAFISLPDQQVDAVDPLLEQYARSFPHFVASDYPHVRFFNQPLEEFSSDKKYDLVLALNAINHVANLERCLDRLVCLTKPGGTLLLSIDAHKSNWLQRVFQLLPADILHPHQYTLAAYEAMLHQRNLQVCRVVLLQKKWIFDYYLLVGKLPVENT